MITLVTTIWHSLDLTQQIIVSISGGLILAVVGLFIYGRAKKTLYLVPSLLYKIHTRAKQLANDLNITNVDDVSKFLSLSGVNMKDYESVMTNVGDEEDIAQLIISLSDKAKAKSKSSINENENIPLRIAHFLNRQTGLTNRLADDKVYQRLIKKLENIRPFITTEEISNAVNSYTNASLILNALTPLLGQPKEVLSHLFSGEQLKKILSIYPLELELDMLGVDEKIEHIMTTLHAKVWESIDKYYRSK